MVIPRQHGNQKSSNKDPSSDGVSFSNSIKCICPFEILPDADKTHLEYCSSVWTNCGKVAADKLERVQLRAARYILRHRRHESTYSDRLRLLNLPTLAWRRRIHQLSMF